MKKIASIIFSIIATILIRLPQVSLAQSATAKSDVLSIEDIWRQPELNGLTLARDGKSMAATVPFKGRMNLAVIDLETRKANLLSSYDNYDVLGASSIFQK